MYHFHQPFARLRRNPFTAAAVTSVLPSVLNTAGSIYANNSNRESQIALQREQNAFSERMWQKNNAFNSPVNQMRMLSQAGINPNFSDGVNMFQPSSPATSPASPNVMNEPKFSLEFDPLVSENLKGLRLKNDEQELKNRDLRNDISAKEEVYPDGLDLDDYDSNTMDFSSEVYPSKNAYQFRTASERADLQQKRLTMFRFRREMEDYFYQRPYLRQMTIEQLNQLYEDVTSKRLGNDILSNDVRLLKEYGFDVRAKDVVHALVRMCLTNPDSMSKALSALSSAGYKTFGDALDALKKAGQDVGLIDPDPTIFMSHGMTRGILGKGGAHSW